MDAAAALAIAALALLLLVWGLRMRAATGMPWAPVRYDDSGWRAPDRPLMARRIGLVGRPDYLVEIRGRTIPVEVKPGRRAARPYDSDLMQLAAYCLLVEETTGAAPPYGLLRYAEQTFRLDYSPRLRAEVLELLEEMRADREADSCARSHADRYRCLACGFAAQCDQALAQGDEDE